MSFPSDIEIRGRLRDASNATFLCVNPATNKEYVYKPTAGERPLWDFPEGTLTGREIAAAEIDRILGWSLVPRTEWISNGPLGAGMLQEWVSEIDQDRPVNIFDPHMVPDGWHAVLHAQDQLGNPIVLAHGDQEHLRRIAIFDSVINNADRKAGHILAVSQEQFFGIDHGVSFHQENKLRTVLWGWAGQQISTHFIEVLEALEQHLGAWHQPVDQWLNQEESQALRLRIRDLISTGLYPSPSRHWPAIPWPVF